MVIYVLYVCEPQQQSSIHIKHAPPTQDSPAHHSIRHSTHTLCHPRTAPPSQARLGIPHNQESQARIHHFPALHTDRLGIKQESHTYPTSIRPGQGEHTGDTGTGKATRAVITSRRNTFTGFSDCRELCRGVGCEWGLLVMGKRV